MKQSDKYLQIKSCHYIIYVIYISNNVIFRIFVVNYKYFLFMFVIIIENLTNLFTFFFISVLK